MIKLKLLLASLLVLILCPNTKSQLNFTRVTDPANPVVTDQHESTGGCWVDFNNDGWLDLFVSNGNLTSQNNSLYLNNRSGSFIKIITGAIVNDGGSSIGGTWGDFNNDGNLDLFVSNRNNFGNFLYKGNGDTTFTKITTGNIVTDLANSNSSGWIDINRDGFIDLHVINFSQNDFLYINDGNPNYTFTKIDTASFLQDGGGFSIVGAWADFNNDRLPDFFVGNGGTQNDFIFKNNGNLTFDKTILNDTRATLGASWGDYDNDGDLDLFTAGFLNQKSILYNNSGAPNFTLTPVDTGIVSNDPANSIGSCWGDFDNDGDMDLFVANDGQNNFLYMNSGSPNYSFTKITTGSIVNDGGNTFGCASGDYDNDGQLDIFAANRLNQQNFLYHNNGNNNKWITIKCTGITSNKAAIGTKVRIKAVINGIPAWQMQEIVPQTGYNSQNLWLHFGTGSTATIDSIRVEWTNGLTHHFTNVGTNQFITILENGTIIGINNLNEEIPQGYNLYQNNPNPFNPSTTIQFSVGNEHMYSIRLIVSDITGRQVAELINRNLPAGEYSISFSNPNLSSGIYFYSMLIDGKIIQTKKMILIK